MGGGKTDGKVEMRSHLSGIYTINHSMASKLGRLATDSHEGIKVECSATKCRMPIQSNGTQADEFQNPRPAPR
jgi:hypothetical protein